MTNNGQQMISKVRPFAEMAESRGCYTKNQRWNLETAWTLLLKNLSRVGDSPDSITVDEIRPLIDGIFRRYGNENRVSPATVHAYATRVRRLLSDFIEHYGGDFMEWKESIGRASTLASKTRSRRRSARTEGERPIEPIVTSEPAKTVSHRLVFSQGREGSLVLPAEISDTDIEPVWEQLEALKTLVKAQLAAKQAGKGS